MDILVYKNAKLVSRVLPTTYNYKIIRIVCPRSLVNSCV